MTNHSSAQRELVDLLGLTHAPVAITFHAERPADADWFDAPMTDPTEDGRSGRVPASCVFWADAHEATFTTAPEDHGNCSVGRFTHGLVGAEGILDKADVGTLLEVGWVTMEAFADVAALDRSPAAITYGPLADSDGDHDVVLLRISPKQMMEIGDAITVEFSGKPQCQIIPRAADRNVVAASMGCALSRARIGMGDDEMTCAVPAGRVDELLEGLRAVCRADEAVVGYALADKARF
jgi:uncharacterized protein (DUF169 family)